MSATIEGEYRYDLTRGDEAASVAARRMTFVMLNPSTADASVDDPTIRRCLGFARREGCALLTVVNLYALRATDPRALWSHPDPVGPRNDAFLRAAVSDAGWYDGIMVAAWGVNARADRVATLRGILNGLPIWALGLTKDGSPRHPLYVRGDAPLVPWA